MSVRKMHSFAVVAALSLSLFLTPWNFYPAASPLNKNVSHFQRILTWKIIRQAAWTMAEIHDQTFRALFPMVFTVINWSTASCNQWRDGHLFFSDDRFSPLKLYEIMDDIPFLRAYCFFSAGVRRAVLWWYARSLFVCQPCKCKQQRWTNVLVSFTQRHMCNAALVSGFARRLSFNCAPSFRLHRHLWTVFFLPHAIYVSRMAATNNNTVICQFVFVSFIKN